MIDTSPDSIRIFAILVLGIVWLYLLTEHLAVNSVENEKSKKK